MQPAMGCYSGACIIIVSIAYICPDGMQSGGQEMAVMVG